MKLRDLLSVTNGYTEVVVKNLKTEGYTEGTVKKLKNGDYEVLGMEVDYIQVDHLANTLYIMVK